TILDKLRVQHHYCLYCGCKSLNQQEHWQMNALGLMKMITDPLCQW
uniref:Uncharacterized protein n=1 Tax=Aegilops tauschii subsp. strangulata TaxID=200361 RepID=A0A453RJU3_AEGTS